jgi:hypothetical protein
VGFWNDKANHRAFFDWLGKELGVTQAAGWYDVDKSAVYKRGGAIKDAQCNQIIKPVFICDVLTCRKWPTGPPLRRQVLSRYLPSVSRA